jgi:hypothetical protein
MMNILKFKFIIIKRNQPEHREKNNYEAIEMAKTQMLNILHNAKELLHALHKCSDFEPWQASKLTIADDYVSKVKESVVIGS